MSCSRARLRSCTRASSLSAAGAQNATAASSPGRSRRTSCRAAEPGKAGRRRRVLPPAVVLADPSKLGLGPFRRRGCTPLVYARFGRRASPRFGTLTVPRGTPAPTSGLKAAARVDSHPANHHMCWRTRPCSGCARSTHGRASPFLRPLYQPSAPLLLAARQSYTGCTSVVAA